MKGIRVWRLLLICIVNLATWILFVDPHLTDTWWIAVPVAFIYGTVLAVIQGLLFTFYDVKIVSRNIPDITSFNEDNPAWKDYR